MDPEHTASAAWLWQFVTVGGSISAIVLSAAAFIRSCRRYPPISEEMYRSFITKSDFETLRAEITRSLSSGTTVFREIERALGKIEGQLARCPYFCKFEKEPQK